jgi:hypothetical protein
MGDFEERLKQVMKKSSSTKTHSVHRRNPYRHRLGATSGGAMDASNLLKPALAQGDFAAWFNDTRNTASISRRTARWSAVPEDRRQGAERADAIEIPSGGPRPISRSSTTALHRRSGEGGGGTPVALHPRPQAS